MALHTFYLPRSKVGSPTSFARAFASNGTNAAGDAIFLFAQYLKHKKLVALDEPLRVGGSEVHSHA